MNLKQIIAMTGHLPNKATFDNAAGDEIKIELFIRKGFAGGYIAVLWIMDGEQTKEMLEHGFGATMQKAKDALKNKILRG